MQLSPCEAKLPRFSSWYEAHNTKYFHLSIKCCVNFAFGYFEPTEGGLFAVLGTKSIFSLDVKATSRRDGQL